MQFNRQVGKVKDTAGVETGVNSRCQVRQKKEG